MEQIWFTDCKSVEQALMRPVLAKISDKRLGIEIAALRQNLWRTKGSRKGNPILEDNIPKDKDRTDFIRWIDTDIMLVDPMTKVMEPVKLVEALQSGYWNLKQPVESIEKKRAKQKQRHEASKLKSQQKDAEFEAKRERLRLQEEEADADIDSSQNDADVDQECEANLAVLGGTYGENMSRWVSNHDKETRRLSRSIAPV